MAIRCPIRLVVGALSVCAVHPVVHAAEPDRVSLSEETVTWSTVKYATDAENGLVSGSLDNTASVSLPAGFNDPTPADNVAKDSDTGLTTLTPQATLHVNKVASSIAHVSLAGADRLEAPFPSYIEFFTSYKLPKFCA